MRRRLTTVIAIAAAVALIAVPATAQQEHSFVGAAEATSFELSIAGEGLVAGETTAGVQSSADLEGALCQSDIVACATGAGEAVFGDTAEAQSPDNGGPDSVVAFSADQLPDQFPLSGQFGAAEAETSGSPAESARAHANAATLTISSSGGDGGQFGDPFGQLTDQLQNLLGQGGQDGEDGGNQDGEDGGDQDGDGSPLPETGTPLDQILEQLPSSPDGGENPLSPVLEPLTEGLQGLSEQLQSGGDVVGIELGTSDARSSDSEQGVTSASATARGGTVTLLNGLATIEAGNSTVDGETQPGGTPNASASSSPLTVTLASGDQLPPELQDALSQIPQLGGEGGLTIEIPEGQSVCLADEIESQGGGQLPEQAGALTALFDIYISAGGSSTDVQDASAAARADALALEVFNDNCGPSGDSDPLSAAPAVVLNAATAQMSVAAQPAQQQPDEDVQQEDIVREDLPMTGGGAALAGLALVGGAALLLRRRS